jgi:hypothetical protein
VRPQAQFVQFDVPDQRIVVNDPGFAMWNLGGQRREFTLCLNDPPQHSWQDQERPGFDFREGAPDFGDHGLNGRTGRRLLVIGGKR